jgi:hypothetical protein
MARTGLRMMPMFPSSPLKFRTAGFPQYGFKASLSDGACLPPLAVKRAPHMPAPSGSLLRPLPASATERWRGAVSPPVRASTDRCARGPASLPQGVLGSAAGCVVPLPHCLLRPHPPVSPARGDFTAVPLIRRAFAVRERRGDPRETFLTFPAVLATRAADPTPVGPARLSRCLHASSTRRPRTINESPPTMARLCQQYSTGLCISVLHRSRHATARVFAKPS